MPLTDLVRYFNAADHGDEATLYLDDGRAAAWHMGRRLSSVFEPIVDLRSGRIAGHRARLRIQADDATYDTGEDPAQVCRTPAAIVAFDRLCRTLHALNFLVQQRYAGGYLQVSVHPRHLLAVPNQHGMVYEAILRRCGLAPEDIVLEVSGGSADLAPHLEAAFAAYRRRGYRLAIPGELVGDDVELLAALQPDILCSRYVLPVWHGLRQINGVDAASTVETARALGVDFATGPWFGEPDANCRATHIRGRLPYNALSHTGVST